MRILHIIPSLEIGGAERLAFDICNEFYTREHIEVKLITFRKVNEFGSRDFISDVPSSISLSIYKRNQFKVSALQKEIEAFKPDIIHTHLFMAEIVSRSCFYPKAKWFSHFHDNMPQLDILKVNDLTSKTKITNWYEKRFLFKRYAENGGNQFIGISQDAFQYAKKVLPNHSKIHYLKNAINYEAFFSPVKKLTKNQKFQLINVGSFQKKKNQKFLIEVMSLLAARKVNCELTFLGDGAEIADVKERVVAFGLEDSVSFEGNVSNVKDYLNQAHIYVHSAYYEPFGLVLLEAMAAGLPIVCLNGGGNADIIEDGVNGFMLEDASPSEFAQSIEKLIHKEALYNKLAQEGQRTAQQYGIKTYCDKLMELYKASLINGQ